MTVEQNIRSVLQIIEKETNKIELMLDDLLAEFSKPPKEAESLTLSGGERRRVEIARALACQPSFCSLMNLWLGLIQFYFRDKRISYS